MVCSGFEPGTAGWKAQTNPLSYGFEYLEKDSVQLPIRMPNQTTFSVNSLLYLDNGSKFMKHFIECKLVAKLFQGIMIQFDLKACVIEMPLFWILNFKNSWKISFFHFTTNIWSALFPPNDKSEFSELCHDLPEAGGGWSKQNGLSFRIVVVNQGPIL